MPINLDFYKANFQKTCSSAGAICAMISFLSRRDIELIRGWCEFKLKQEVKDE